MLRQLQKFPIQDINNAAPDIAKALEQFYDLGKPVEIRASEFGDTNRNFHIVCEKDGTRQKYFAKIYGAYKTLDKLNYESELYHYFRKNAGDAMHCALPVPSRNGETVYIGECQQAAIEAFFMVFEHLKGDPFDDTNWRYQNHNYMGNFARALARYHKFAYGFEPSSDVPDQRDFLSDLIEQREIIEQFGILRENPRTHEYFEYFAPQKERISNILERDTESYRQVKDQLPTCLSHGDCSPCNFMFDENVEACGVCDFDWSKKRPRLFDVSWVICEALVIYKRAELHSTFDLERLAKFINAYNEEVSTDPAFLPGKLTKEELKMLPCMMELVYMQMTISDRIGYMLENNQRVGASPDNIRVSNFGISGINSIEENFKALQSLADLCG